jgi:hypothetical protein
MSIIIATLLLLSAASGVGAQPPDDEAFKKQLVAASPVKLNWEAVGRTERGELVILFKEEGGKFRGEVVSVTGTAPSARVAGQVKFLNVKGGVLTFTTQGGGDYELSFTPEGKIGGSARSLRGTPMKISQ